MMSWGAEMLRISTFLVAVLLSASACSQPLGRNGDLCADPQPTDQKISACTALIKSGALTKPEFLAKAYAFRGAGFIGLAQYDRAIADYSEAIRLFPEAGSYINLSFALAHSGRVDEAIAANTKAISLSPNNSIAYHSRGVDYATKELYKQAIADFDKSIAINSNYANSYYSRGSAYANIKEYKLALEDYNKALELKPEYTAAYVGRGLTYLYLLQYDRAIADETRAITLDPRTAAAYANRALAYEDTGLKDQAIADLRSALAIEPNAEPARDGLNRLGATP